MLLGYWKKLFLYYLYFENLEWNWDKNFQITKK